MAEHLGASLETLILGVRELRVAHAGISSKGAVALCSALQRNKRSATSLQVMDMNGNPIGQEGVAAALEFLSGANVVSDIDVSGTGCFLDTVLATLSTSIFEHLSTLSLKDCKFSQRYDKRGWVVTNEGGRGRDGVCVCACACACVCVCVRVCLCVVG